MGKKPIDEGAVGEQHPSALERMFDRASGDDDQVGHENDPLRESHPSVWEWMTRTRYKGGDFTCHPGTLSIAMTPTGVMATITIRDLKRAVSVMCDHIGQVYEALERAINSPNPPIREWGKGEVKIRKRRKS